MSSSSGDSIRWLRALVGVTALAALFVACSRESRPNPGSERAASPAAEIVEIRVSAAASLRDALTAVAPEFERAHSVRLVINLGSSGDLARQILATDASDVFLSADPLEIDRVEREGRVRPDSRIDLWSNQLVVIESSSAAGSSSARFSEPFSVEQLTSPAITQLALADPRSVPAGRYAKRWLEERGAWDAIAPRVVPAVDVRAALALVESAAVDAGIVYATDAAIRKSVRVVYRVPLAEGPRIVYVGAAIAGRGDARLAREFLDYLRGESAVAEFERFGFLKVDSEAH